MLSQEMRALTSSVYCTRTPAALRPVDPIAGDTCASNTATFNPRSLRQKAQDAPIIPAPITTTSVLTLDDISACLLSCVRKFRYSCAASCFLFPRTKSCRCRFIDYIEIGQPYKLLLTPMIVYNHAVFKFSRLERDISVDDIVQHQFYRALERVSITAAAWKVKLDAVTWREGSHRLSLRTGRVVHEMFVRCAGFAAREPGSGEAGAVNQRRKSPGSIAPVADLGPLPQPSTVDPRATRIGAQFPAVLDQRGQALHDFSWHAG